MDQTPDNDRDIKLTASIDHALEPRSAARLFMSPSDAWHAIRRKIAEEKIHAAGKSRLRSEDGREAWFDSEQIPSGDAGDLEILSARAGFGRKDALVPASWQGRYWYDVRLRAADVFREFPREVEPDAIFSVDLPKAQVRRGRRKGSGSYERQDQKLLDEMRALINEGQAASPEAASHLVAGKAIGSGSPESKAERLAKRFRASRNIDRNKSD